MSEQQNITPAQIEALLKERYKATEVKFKGATPIADPFNEVSKAEPPDFAWYVLADVTTIEDGEEETTAMSFQIGEKDRKLDIYCTWDYSIFDHNEEERERSWGA